MRLFRDLLKYDPASTPGDEQRRASKGLAAAIAQSHMRWWKGRQPMPSHEKCLILVVAPFSQYDLTLLDLIDEKLGNTQPSVPVFVGNLQDYDSVEELIADFPGIGPAPQTPIAALCDPGSSIKVACGKKAREMAAQALGLSSEELMRRVLAESPSYSNPTNQQSELLS